MLNLYFPILLFFLLPHRKKKKKIGTSRDFYSKKSSRNFYSKEMLNFTKTPINLSEGCEKREIIGNLIAGLTAS